MANYTDIKGNILIPIVGEGAVNITPMADPSGSETLSPRVFATVGSYREFAFTAVAGSTWSCDPDAGVGTGELLKESADLFPLVGDDKLYYIKVKVLSVVSNNYQLAIIS